MSTFPERMVQIRNNFGISQGKMAKQLKITPAHISNLETGKRSPSDIIIAMICKEFSVSEVWLRTGEGEPFFNTSAALQKEFATCFIEITKAFSPVFSAYGEVMPVFRNQEVMRMYNYIALRLHRGGFNEKNVAAICQAFDVAFPGYSSVIESLENQSSFIYNGFMDKKDEKS